jgi:hypothetical protein
MKRSVQSWLLILALASVGLAQSAHKDERELWLVRSQNVTNDLLKDASDLSSLQRAVLWAKLAQRWWREDQKRARTWIADAIETVKQVPNKETQAEREDRLEAARVLLTIVTPLDQKFTKSLMTVLTAGDKSAEPNWSSDALIDAAVVVVNDDPKRAAELGALALRSGAPDNLEQLLFPLRARDATLADGLFEQAMVVVRQDPRSKLSNSLMFVAFPAQRGLPANTPVPPEPMRMELLQYYVGMINKTMIDNVDQNSTCGTVSWLSPVLPEIDRLLPKQMLLVRQAINRCQSPDPHVRLQIDEALRSQPLNTVESLLKAGLDANDLETRTEYEFRAADLAADNKDYDRAIKILDDMSQEQRDAINESWTSWRRTWAAEGAVEHYKNGRFREMNLMLDGVPSDIQPFAKADFVNSVPEKAVSETAPLIQILNDAIKGLRRSNIPETDKYDWYFGLLRTVVKYQPADANAVLKDAIASLNQVEEVQPLNMTDWLKYLGPPLVEMDEFIVKDALASIKPVPYRAQLRLALLDATLQRVKPTARN